MMLASSSSVAGSVTAIDVAAPARLGGDNAAADSVFFFFIFFPKELVVVVFVSTELDLATNINYEPAAILPL